MKILEEKGGKIKIIQFKEEKNSFWNCVNELNALNDDKTCNVHVLVRIKHKLIGDYTFHGSNFDDRIFLAPKKAFQTISHICEECQSTR